VTGTVAVTRALRACGWLVGAGQTISTEDGTEGLVHLNGMLAQMSLDKAMVFTTATGVYDLTSGRADYIIAPGQTTPHFDAPRPIKIESAGIRVENPHDTNKWLRIPLKLITSVERAAIADKFAEATVPENLFYDQAATGSLYLWPIPTFTGTPKPAIELTTWAQLSSYASLATDNTFPPGYDNAIVHNLACRLAPFYGLQCPAEVAAQAAAGMNLIRRRNAEWFGIPLE
jgi:hypothetical protein